MTHAKKSGALPWDAVLFLALGIVFEIAAVVQRFFVENLASNAVTGMIASLVLFYGGIRFLMTINVGLQASGWVILSGFLYLMFRVVDVVETIHRDYFARLLRVEAFFDGTINFDAVLRDVFIVTSAMALFIGVAQALYISYKAQRLLSEQNAALDAEVRDHKVAESRARMSQETLSVLINALSAAVFLVDRRGRIVTHNRYFAGMLGDGQQDLCGKTLEEVMPFPLYIQDIQSNPDKDALDAPRVYIKRYNGRTYDVKAHPLLDSEGALSNVAVLAQDITERLAAEQSRALLDTAITCVAETVMITNDSGTIEYVNPAFEHITGYSAREACGQTPALLRSGQHQADFYRMLWATISAGDVWRGEFINQRKNGELYREQATISSITDANGKITHYVAVKRDITRERELERQVQQTQKIDMIGTLAGGISHDFNNVLAIIMGHSELASQGLEPGHPMHKHIESITRTAARSSKITRRLLAFSRQETDEAGPIPVAAIIQEQAKNLRVYIPSNVAIEEKVPDDVGHIFAEQSEVQQILVNLCTNASHAMQPNGGVLSISLDAVTLDSLLLVTTGEIAPGNYVRLRVCDTGHGMDDETLQRIFEPFYTTKKSNVGTGLGLAMVHGSVSRFGGAVGVVSKPGQGTQFEVYWPVTEYTAPVVVKTEETLSGDGRYVLVVDDIKDFSALTELNLVNYGFRVEAFANPREAATFFQDHHAEIDAVITDYMMPEMNGAELARILHRIRPKLPIILLTGYASDITETKAREYGFSHVLRKPTASATLVRTLIQLIPSRH